jgi:hypothetical protein
LFRTRRAALSELDSVKAAKKSVRNHIKFFQNLLEYIREGKDPALTHAMWTAYCLHRYIEDKLIDDVIEAMKLKDESCQKD